MEYFSKFIPMGRQSNSTLINMELFNDIKVMAGTLWGEARNQGDDGMIAVGHVILNRVKANSWYGNNIQEVCLKPWQFSCWNDNDPNKEKILQLDQSDDSYCKAVTISCYLLDNKIYDTTYGSTHYHTKSILPKWVEDKQPIVAIRDHLFYNNIK